MQRLLTTAVFGVLALALGAFPVLAEEGDSAGHTSPLEKWIEKMEEAAGLQEEKSLLSDHLQVSGLVEVEAFHEKLDFDDPEEEDEKSSGVDLATVEMALDAAIQSHVSGHVLIKYQEDDLFVDEGFITLTGSETFPVYLKAGRLYIPFGYFDTYFITDPNTLILGEIREGAVVAGYTLADDRMDFSLGGFNGKAGKKGQEDTMDGFVAGFTARLLENVTFGVSYTSSLASADAFSEAVTDRDEDGEIDPVENLVGGWSAFVTLYFAERFTVMGEYLAALEKFKAGELFSSEDAVERKPSAWNIELGVAVTESLELAVRCGGSDDGGNLLPESQVGAVLNWGLFDETLFAIEYLHGHFESDTHKTDSLTAQLAMEF
ncbi:MAG: LbtU family siderophore porin [Proteobacteria bacterium]|nr:LbtU family siderophore porin [Pseudomonadota bacterium]